jgi:hypothetical protein
MDEHRNRDMNMNRRSSEKRAALSATEAREGVTGHNVRYVLGISVVAAAVLLLVIWLYYFT